jgi:hypothetical protein
MPSYEAVCDCCMLTVLLDTPIVEQRDCPECGVGKLLGPWPVERFESHADIDVHFRLGEAAERD